MTFTIQQLNTTQWGFDFLPADLQFDDVVEDVLPAVVDGLVGTIIAVRDGSKRPWQVQWVPALLIDLVSGETIPYTGEETFTKPIRKFFRAMGRRAVAGDWKYPRTVKTKS